MARQECDYYDGGVVNYSETEHVVGTWITGKPLYEKTIKLSAPTVTTNGTYVTSEISHNISNVGVIFIVHGFLKNGNVFRPLMYLVNAGYQIKASVSLQKFQLVSGVTDFSGNDIYLTIRYTKTTD